MTLIDVAYINSHLSLSFSHPGVPSLASVLQAGGRGLGGGGWWGLGRVGNHLTGRTGGLRWCVGASVRRR